MYINNGPGLVGISSVGSPPHLRLRMVEVYLVIIYEY